MLRKKRPLVFIHVPKTGGSSLHEVLTKELKDRKLCPARFSSEISEYSKNELAEYDLFSGHFGAEDCSLIEKPQYITLLRNPVDRVVSLYSYWRAQRGKYLGTPETDQNYAGVQLAINSSIDDFVRTQNPAILAEISNTQSLYILYGLNSHKLHENILPEPTVEEVIRKLKSNFLWYGTLEQLSASCESLWEKLHVKVEGNQIPIINKTPANYKAIVSEETYKIIADLNRVDMALHTHVTNLERSSTNSLTHLLERFPLLQANRV